MVTFLPASRMSMTWSSSQNQPILLPGRSPDRRVRRNSTLLVADEWGSSKPWRCRCGTEVNGGIWKPNLKRGTTTLSVVDVVEFRSSAARPAARIWSTARGTDEALKGRVSQNDEFLRLEGPIRTQRHVKSSQVLDRLGWTIIKESNDTCTGQLGRRG